MLEPRIGMTLFMNDTIIKEQNVVWYSCVNEIFKILSIKNTVITLSTPIKRHLSIRETTTIRLDNIWKYFNLAEDQLEFDFNVSKI